ncbi:MAG: hypothetical protein GEEBNDBF_02606 [bacterium]|nr:hypothetical protein [bacterium]
MRALVLLLTGVLMSLTVATPAPAAEPVRTPGGMLMATLPNGMQLLIVENHAAPVAVVNTWFRVGARNEQPADAGISHFLEHMLFDGSVGMPLDDFNRILFQNAIDNNASTDQDNTNYFHVGPADKLREIAHMTALLVSQPVLLDSEFGREREVVKEELRQGLDNPGWFLGDLVLPAAMAHAGYRHPVIGDAPTLDAQTNEQMREYYRRFYGPNNAFTIAVGDFNAEDALQILTEEFSAWQPTEIAPDPGTTPYSQTAPQSLVGVRDYATNHIAAVWPTTAARADETYALQVLAAILGQGDASRLVRRLRDELGLVSDISTSTQELITQSAFWLSAEMADPAQTLAATEEIFRVIRQLKEQGPTASELDRARRQLMLQHLFLGEDVQSQAYTLGYYINATGSPLFFEDYAARLAGVNAADVQWAAQHFLPAAHITLGLATAETGAAPLTPNWSLLDPSAAPLERPGDIGRLGTSTQPIYPASQAAGAGAAPTTLTLRNGMRVLVKPVLGTGTVGLTLAAPQGLDLESWETNGLGALLERTLTKGTTTRSADDILGLIDHLGGRFEVSVSYDTTSLSGLYAADDLATALPLIADLISQATFPEEEVAVARDILLAEITARADESYNTTHDQLTLAMWGQDVAYGRPPLGRPAAVSALTREHLLDHAVHIFDPSTLVLTLTGDIDPATVQPELETIFGGLPVRKRQTGTVLSPAIPRSATGLQRIVQQTAKAQTMSVLGLPGVALHDPDLPAIQAVNMVLGGSWLSRLFDRLRGKEGLAYGTYSRVEAYRDGGILSARIGTRPEMWEQAITGLQREFRLIATEGITAEELATAVTYSRGQTLMSLAGMQAQSQAMALNVARDLPWDFDWQLLQRMAGVTVEEANRVATTYFQPANAWLAVTGDLFTPAVSLE